MRRDVHSIRMVLVAHGHTVTARFLLNVPYPQECGQWSLRRFNGDTCRCSHKRHTRRTHRRHTKGLTPKCVPFHKYAYNDRFPYPQERGQWVNIHVDGCTCEAPHRCHRDKQNPSHKKRCTPADHPHSTPSSRVGAKTTATPENSHIDVT